MIYKNVIKFSETRYSQLFLKKICFCKHYFKETTGRAKSS